MDFAVGRVFRRAQVIIQKLPLALQEPGWSGLFLPNRPNQLMFAADELLDEEDLAALKEANDAVSSRPIIAFTIFDHSLLLFLHFTTHLSVVGAF